MKDSIGWRIQRYLILFIVAILALLWIFQVVFLDSFYRVIKTQEIRNLATQIQSTYVPGVELDIGQEALNRETHIRIVNSDGIIIQDSIGIPNPMVQKIDKAALKQIFSSIDYKGKTVTLIDEGKPKPPKEKTSSLTYALKLDDQTMVLIQTQIMPVDATTQTIRVQLFIVSGLLIIISIILTRVMYKRISEPIIEINENAKVLASGDYTKPFKGEGYKEIEELSDTLNKMRSDLSQVETLRNELIANVSHDLRTPLTMIGGYAELMKEIPQEMNEENLDIIINETKRLNHLVKDILDLSALQSGMQTLNETVFDIGALIREFVQRMQNLYPQRNVIYKNTHEINVSADRIKIEQALYNIVINALTHTDGDVEIVVKQNPAIRIEISDQGPGMASDELDEIWQRYYQSKTDHKRSQYGSGLGLSIVRNIFDLHGVQYGVESSVASGTTFWFELNKGSHSI